MAFQSVPETAEIVIRYSQHGETYNNVLHAKLVGGYALADLQALADAVDLGVAAEWLPHQTDECLYNDTTVRGLEFENDQEAVAFVSTGSGAVIAKSNPGNVTLSVKKGSNKTGRSARGRLYWIGIPVTQLSANENVLTVGAVFDIVAAVNNLRIDIDNTVWKPVIVSRFSGGVARPVGITFDWTVTTAVNDNVDSQRSRLNV